MSKLDGAIRDLRGIVTALRRLEHERMAEADLFMVCGKLANVLGTVSDELEIQQKRITALDNDLGDHLLLHKKEAP